MKIYHVTILSNAKAIMKDGFRDPPVSNAQLCGVWFSDKPCWDGGYCETVPLGHSVVAVTLLRQTIDRFAVNYDGATYREWCIPAHVINNAPRELLSTG
jgi:hypothetical protein